MSCFWPFMLRSVNPSLSEVLNEVSFASRADLIECRCANLRTPFTVVSPGLAHGAAAHLQSEVVGQSVFTATRLRHHPEALALLRRRLHTNVPLKNKSSFTGTFEAAKSVQTVSVLTHAL